MDTGSAEHPHSDADPVDSAPSNPDLSLGASAPSSPAPADTSGPLRAPGARGPRSRPRPRKAPRTADVSPRVRLAIFLGYLGDAYQGMQHNPGARTVERHLYLALLAAGLAPRAAPDDPAADPVPRYFPDALAWTRAARTDKGVSAVGQLIAVSLPLDALLALPTGASSLAPSTEAVPSLVPDTTAARAPAPTASAAVPPLPQSLSASHFEALTRALNAALPEDIRIFGAVRATKLFNAKNFCDKRRYEYLLPFAALKTEPTRQPRRGSAGTDGPLYAQNEAAANAAEPESMQIEDNNTTAQVDIGAGPELNMAAPSAATSAGIPTGSALCGKCNDTDTTDADIQLLVRFNALLQTFVGSHNFHNYTESETRADDPQAFRNILSFDATGPIELKGVKYVKVVIVGQSFILHQIRKMVGMAIQVFRGAAPEDALLITLSPKVVISVPMAPAVGLLLERCYFDRYNKKQAHQPNFYGEISADAFQDKIDAFKESSVYPSIVNKTTLQNVFGKWIRSTDALPLDIYDVEGIFQKKKMLQELAVIEEQRQNLSTKFMIVSQPQLLFGSCSSNTDGGDVASAAKNAFQTLFKFSPTHYVRVPGTLTLLGEGLDSCELPGITVATEEFVLAAVGSADDDSVVVARIHALEPALSVSQVSLKKTGKRLATAAPAPDAAPENTDWEAHAAWGWDAAVKSQCARMDLISGAKMILLGGTSRSATSIIRDKSQPLIGGDAGEAATIACSALASMRINNHRASKLDVVSIASSAQRINSKTIPSQFNYVTSLCSQLNCINYVEFLPKLDSVPLRLDNAGVSFVLLKLYPSEQYQSNIGQYQKRLAECRLAAHILAKRLGLNIKGSVTFGRIAQVANKDCNQMSSLCEQLMPLTESISLDNAVKELNTTAADVSSLLTDVFKDNCQCNIGACAAYVYSEAARAKLFCDVLNGVSVNNDSESLIDVVSKLFLTSETALHNFKCLPDRGRRVSDWCRKNGAYGSRCALLNDEVVCVVGHSQTSAFISAVKAHVEQLGVKEVSEMNAATGAMIYTDRDMQDEESRNKKAKFANNRKRKGRHF